MSTTAINVSYVDNELYIIAIPSNGMASSELLHYMSGFGDKMNVTIVPQHVLPHGNYTLCFIGINWGGPAGFAVTTTTDGTVTPVPPPPGTSALGVVWHQTLAITV